MKHELITGEIIGAALAVLSKLRPGLDESFYEKALELELMKRSRIVSRQRQFQVFYDGLVLGTLIPDMMVDDAVIVDAKVVTGFNDTHISQMLGYLAITGKEVALLLNFRYADLQWKRVVRTADMGGGS